MLTLYDSFLFLLLSSSHLNMCSGTQWCGVTVVCQCLTQSSDSCLCIGLHLWPPGIEPALLMEASKAGFPLTQQRGIN